MPKDVSSDEEEEEMPELMDDDLQSTYTTPDTGLTVEFHKFLENLYGGVLYNVHNPEIYTGAGIDDVIIVKPENRITSRFISEFELTEVISIRSKQIEDGSPIFVDYGNITNAMEIAQLEIDQKKCPLSVVRMLNTRIGKIWKVSELVCL